MKLIKKTLREPLVHFLIIGALIFIISGIIEKDYIDEDYRIEITKPKVETMFKKWVAQLKRMPTQEEFDIYIENYLENEILYREAKTMGLDKDDIIIKQRMVQKLEFITGDLISMSEPTDDQVVEYFDENTDKYTIPGRIDFVHIFFSIVNTNLDNLKKRAEKLKNRLNRNSTLTEKYFELGDPFILPYEYANISMDEVERKFGTSELSNELFAQQINQWIGPYLSTYGMHLALIKSKRESTKPDFEEVKEKIKSEIADERNRKAYKDFLTELRKKYSIQYSDELKAFADSLNFPLKEI